MQKLRDSKRKDVLSKKRASNYAQMEANRSRTRELLEQQDLERAIEESKLDAIPKDEESKEPVESSKIHKAEVEPANTSPDVATKDTASLTIIADLLQQVKDLTIANNARQRERTTSPNNAGPGRGLYFKERPSALEVEAKKCAIDVKVDELDGGTYRIVATKQH